ncbi:MAG TPA: hypothetical protein VHK69_20205, partial [Chitinophagaceae bacterium]|nr:hypothetical protein [Chitinophagaceae bacterium]
MPTHIKCPACTTEFDVEHVLSSDVEQRLKKQYEQERQQNLAQLSGERRRLEEEQKLFEEKKQKENELFKQKLQQERQKLEADLQQQLRRSISADYENELRLLKQGLQ